MASYKNLLTMSKNVCKNLQNFTINVSGSVGIYCKFKKINYLYFMLMFVTPVFEKLLRNVNST